MASIVSEIKQELELIPSILLCVLKSNFAFQHTQRQFLYILKCVYQISNKLNNV